MTKSTFTLKIDIGFEDLLLIHRILRSLDRRWGFTRIPPEVRKQILDEVDSNDDELDRVIESLWETAIVDNLEECGQCGHYHRHGYYDECRNNNERYP